MSASEVWAENAPLPRSYWEALRRLAEPLELMKFTLIYDGDLPSAGNGPKPIPASFIRNAFHDQLADLWSSHVVMRQIARTARVRADAAVDIGVTKSVPKLPEFNDPIPPVEDGYIDLAGPIQVPGVGGFTPLIRKSLYLACTVDVLFLRHEEPFNLMKNGGDLDGRIKTLFGALRMPDPRHEYVGDTPTADPLYVVMEDDAMISDFSVRSGRLLGIPAQKKHAVRLQVDITVKVLRFTEENQGLIGG